MDEPEEGYESGEVHEPPAAPEDVYESGESYDEPTESQQVYESDHVYDQLAEPEPVSQTDSSETGFGNQQGDVTAPPEGDAQRGEGIPSFDGMDYPEGGEVESTYDGELPMEDQGLSDEQDEGRQANGEATHRRGSSVLQ